MKNVSLKQEDLSNIYEFIYQSTLRGVRRTVLEGMDLADGAWQATFKRLSKAVDAKTDFVPKEKDGPIREGDVKPSLEMLRFFEAEIENKKTYNTLEPCSLADAESSLVQMPDGVLFKIVRGRINRKVFISELKKITKACGEDYQLPDFF